MLGCSVRVGERSPEQQGPTILDSLSFPGSPMAKKPSGGLAHR
jgi:hypothetical protein